MKTIKLSEVKVGNIYTFNFISDTGAGSGSQGWFNFTGKVKEVNAEFIRVFKNDSTKQSIKINNKSIVKIFGF